MYVWSHFESTWAQISVVIVRAASLEARLRQCSVLSLCSNVVSLSMMQIQNNILIVYCILSLFSHFFVKSWLGTCFLFLPLQKLAIWLLGYEALDKFFFAEAGITIEIHPADDRHHVFVAGQASMLPQERLEVLLIDEAITPVINLGKSSVIVKLFAALNRLFLLFHHPIEGDLLLKEAGKLGFNSWT